jgi:hypothetical protein
MFSKIIKDKGIFFVFLLAVVLLLNNDPIFSPDTGSYENNSILRIGMYPLIINFFKFLFKMNAFKYLAIFQTLFSLGTIYFLTKFLRTFFNLNFYLHVALVGIFLFPLATHVSAFNIISESIAYPLFLLTSLSFFKVLAYKDTKNTILFVTFLFLLCFTRQQFVFFYVVAFIYGIYMMIFEKNIKISSKVFLASALSLCSFFIAEKSYHKIYHGHFAGTPFAGTQLLMRPLFVASSIALKGITEPKQKQFIIQTMKEFKENEITSPDQPAKELYAYEYLYNKMYHTISSKHWGNIWTKKTLDKEFKKNHTSFEVMQIVDYNALMMSINLIQHNFVAYSVYYIKDTMRGMGGYSYCLFLFIILLCCLVVSCKRKKMDFLYLILTCSALMHLGNSALVCLFEPPLTRYVYYTSTLLFAVIVIFMAELFPYMLQQSKKSCAE